MNEPRHQRKRKYSQPHLDNLGDRYAHAAAAHLFVNPFQNQTTSTGQLHQPQSQPEPELHLYKSQYQDPSSWLPSGASNTEHIHGTIPQPDGSDAFQQSFQPVQRSCWDLTGYQQSRTESQSLGYYSNPLSQRSIDQRQLLPMSYSSNSAVHALGPVMPLGDTMGMIGINVGQLFASSPKPSRSSSSSLSSMSMPSQSSQSSNPTHPSHSHSSLTRLTSSHGSSSKLSNAFAPLSPQPGENSNHLIANEGDILHSRYEVHRLLGRGTFATTFLCRDLLADQLANIEENASYSSKRREVMVAVKIVRNIDRYKAAAEREARLLQHLTDRRTARSDIDAHTDFTTNGDIPGHSTNGAEGCVPFLGSFLLPSNHYCLVFPVLGLSLYDFLKLHHFRPLFSAHIRSIAYQLLLTCHYLHDECGIIHADIKPENILFVDSSFSTVTINDVDVNIPVNTAVRLIDFGTAVHANDRDKPAIVASRAYRSVEIVLGIGWHNGVDLWSIGCVLMELYTGQRLFNVGHGHDREHLAAMEEVLGAIPPHIQQAPRVYPPSNTHVSASSSSDNHAHGNCRSPLPPLADRIVPGDLYFFDLVSRLLCYDTSKRVTAKQALQHPYFTQASDGGSGH